MAKHRQRAEMIHAQATGSASRIWRSVVVAGAMLGTPLVAAAEAPPPAAKKRAPPADEPGAPEPPQTKAELAAQARAHVKEIERQLAAVDKDLATTLRAHDRTKDAAARSRANARIRALRAERKQLERKHSEATLAARKAAREARAEADAKKRPRNENRDRPVGRGFVLS